MEDFVQELKSNKILAPQDIVRLRIYIESKYPNSDIHKRANILVNSIRKIIDGYLITIPTEQQIIVRESLLRNTLLSKKENIVLYDIFNTLISIYDEKNNLQYAVLDWVNCYLKKPIDFEDILPYFPSICEDNLDYQDSKYNLPSNIDFKLYEQNCNPTNNKFSLNKQVPLQRLQLYLQPQSKKLILTMFTLILIFLYCISYFHPSSIEYKEENIIVDMQIKKESYSHLPEYFIYKDLDENKLKSYLKSRDSLLEDEPYFSSIINSAKEFGLNPLILFAIAGHEQGFVPKTNLSSKKIANNPFNVFVSWQEYNTDIVDSSQIAARTVINLIKDCPDEVDPFQWINRKYAEDKNWWKGVRSIYMRLEMEVNNLSTEPI